MGTMHWWLPGYPFEQLWKLVQVALLKYMRFNVFFCVIPCPAILRHLNSFTFQRKYIRIKRLCKISNCCYAPPAVRLEAKNKYAPKEIIAPEIYSRHDYYYWQHFSICCYEDKFRPPLQQDKGVVMMGKCKTQETCKYTHRKHVQIKFLKFSFWVNQMPPCQLYVTNVIVLISPLILAKSKV